MCSLGIKSIGDISVPQFPVLIQWINTYKGLKQGLGPVQDSPMMAIWAGTKCRCKMTLNGSASPASLQSWPQDDDNNETNTYTAFALVSLGCANKVP